MDAAPKIWQDYFNMQILYSPCFCTSIHFGNDGNNWLSYSLISHATSICVGPLMSIDPDWELKLQLIWSLIHLANFPAVTRMGHKIPWNLPISSGHNLARLMYGLCLYSEYLAQLDMKALWSDLNVGCCLENGVFRMGKQPQILWPTLMGQFI